MRRRFEKQILTVLSITLGVVIIGFFAFLAIGPLLRYSNILEKLCVLDRKSVFDRSRVGIDANAQLAALKTEIQAQLLHEKRRNDALASRGGDEFAQQVSALQTRVTLENAKLENVRAWAISTVIERISPTIKQISDREGCSVIIDRTNLVEVGRATELTDAVVARVENNVAPLSPGSLEGYYRKLGRP